MNIRILFVMVALFPYAALPMQWVKRKNLLDDFDQKIKKETIKILSLYSLDLNCLDDTDVLNQLKKANDEKCKQELKAYDLSQTLEKVDVDSIQEIAHGIFQKAKINNVSILHDAEFTYEDIGVMQLYETNQCYVILNILEHKNQLDKLPAILWHECSHIIYQDHLKKNMIQCKAWCNSDSITQEEIEKETNALSRLLESRADIYAATNLQDQGQSLIAALKLFKPKDNQTHPTIDERISLLQRYEKEGHDNGSSCEII